MKKKNGKFQTTINKSTRKMKYPAIGTQMMFPGSEPV